MVNLYVKHKKDKSMVLPFGLDIVESRLAQDNNLFITTPAQKYSLLFICEKLNKQ